MNKKEVAAVSIVGANMILLIGIIISLSIMSLPKKDASDIFKKNINSIVEVKASSEEIGESYGTGIIIKKRGYLITNSHVVSYSDVGETKTFDKFEVRFTDNEAYEKATFIRMDTKNDLAILRIDDGSQSYRPIKFSTRKLQYGDKCYAIGNTSNFGIGISEGIISVPEVYVTYNDISRLVIQADINISNGNSGGALLDQNGDLIGVTTFRTKDPTGNVNYGFTYSVSLKTLDNFIKGGK